jgi:hypothetical protein
MNLAKSMNTPSPWVAALGKLCMGRHVEGLVGGCIGTNNILDGFKSVGLDRRHIEWA